MNAFKKNTRRLMLSAAFLITAFAAGCGGGGGADPILGIGGLGVTFAPPVGAIIPGAVCPPAVIDPTVPTVTASDPSSGNLVATTSTLGTAGGGKLITATFSLPMNAATINSTTFTVGVVGGAALVPASVTYNAATRVATFRTAAALLPNTSYTAVILAGATSAAGKPVGCQYAWTFKTATVAVAGPAAVNLGLADPYGIASTTGLTSTVVGSTINGDVALNNPSPSCGPTNPAPGGPGTPGFGACGGFAPTLNGTVVTPLVPNAITGTTVTQVFNDLLAAFISISLPTDAPVGTLGGGTPIATATIGGPPLAPLVTGVNRFFPGVYVAASGTLINVTGDLTLDAQGDPNAVFVFQAGSSLDSTAAGTKILLVGGAKASNVWWKVGSSATFLTLTQWQGNVLAKFSISMGTGATSCGRLLAGAAGAGAFAFLANTVSVPGNPFGPPTCL